MTGVWRIRIVWPDGDSAWFTRDSAVTAVQIARAARREGAAVTISRIRVVE